MFQLDGKMEFHSPFEEAGELVVVGFGHRYLLPVVVLPVHVGVALLVT
jgi:hypothetical protein